MGVVLHPRAKTTPRIRKEIQESKESLSKLAKKYNINIKTVLKWKHRDSVEDRKSGPKRGRRALSEKEEKAICEFRRTTLLSIDDIYIALKDTKVNTIKFV